MNDVASVSAYGVQTEPATVRIQRLLPGPIERVWALVTDIDLPARFSSEFQGATWLDDGPAVGARFVGHNHHPAEKTGDCFARRSCAPDHRDRRRARNLNG